MADEQDPPRKFYQLKPREFDRVNPAGPGAAADASPAAGAPSPSTPPAGPIDIREVIRQGAAHTPLLSGNTAANRANDVHSMLAHNLARANAAGINEAPVPPKRPSRRKRDYWLLMVLGNGLFLTLLLLNRGNPIVFVYCLGGMAMFSAGLSWVMWQVMGDY